MKQKKIFPLLVILIIVSSIFSCEKKDEPEPKPDFREVYTGMYTVSDSMFMFGLFSEHKNYSLTISIHKSESNKIVLENLWGSGKNYEANISNDLFTIPSQQVGGPYYTTGNGKIINGNIDYETSGDVYLHKAIGVKQL